MTKTAGNILKKKINAVLNEWHNFNDPATLHRIFTVKMDLLTTNLLYLCTSRFENVEANKIYFTGSVRLISFIDEKTGHHNKKQTAAVSGTAAVVYLCT